MIPAPCPCCAAPAFLIALGVAGSLLLVLDKIIRLSIPNNRIVKIVYKIVTYVFMAVVTLTAIAIGTLRVNDELRDWVFFKFSLVVLVADSPIHQTRCDLIGNIAGKVLEIGPGPGTNFRCWSNNNQITEWVGVEPNVQFQNHLNIEKENKNISFPVSTIWLKGENLDAEPESFDVVVGTHVLCSVDDVNEVLRQVGRALKPGGTYYFMEHVAVDKATNPRIFWAQQIFQPLINTVGNGCLFKRTWENLRTDTGLKGFAEVNMKHIEADMPFPILKPHVIGTAVKK